MIWFCEEHRWKKNVYWIRVRHKDKDDFMTWLKRKTTDDCFVKFDRISTKSNKPTLKEIWNSSDDIYVTLTPETYDHEHNIYTYPEILDIRKSKHSIMSVIYEFGILRNTNTEYMASFSISYQNAREKYERELEIEGIKEREVEFRRRIDELFSYQKEIIESEAEEIGNLFDRIMS